MGGSGFRVCGTHPDLSHRCVAVNPPHDYPKFRQFRSYGHPGGGPGSADEGRPPFRHNVMYFKALAFREADLPNDDVDIQGQTMNRQRSRRRAVGLRPRVRGAAALSLVCVGFLSGCFLSAFMTRCWLTSEAAWDSRALNGDGDGQCWLSVKLLCQGTSAATWLQQRRLALDVIRFGKEVAVRCWLISEATWNSRAVNGDGQCWLSVRLLCQGTSTAAWIHAFNGNGPCWLSARLLCQGTSVAAWILRLPGHDRNRSGAAGNTAEPPELVREQPEFVRVREPSFLWKAQKAPWKRSGGSSREVRVAVVEPSAKTLGLKV